MNRELFKIVSDESDDLKFISTVNKIISVTAQENFFDIVKITKVKNWFDHKWLNYSGKEAIHFDSGDILDVDLALDAKWKKQITIPPFNPNRILATTSYPMNSPINEIDLKPLHKYQASELNLQNRLNLNPENILLCWISSNSKINLKGSLMIYKLINKKVNTWYCQIEKKKEWQIGKTKNISREQLSDMIF